MSGKAKRVVVSFALQLLIYSVLVGSYLWIVLYFLDDWICQINRRDLRLYAFLSLLLIVAQGMLLEAVTTSLVNRFSPKDED